LAFVDKERAGHRRRGKARDGGIGPPPGMLLQRLSKQRFGFGSRNHAGKNIALASKINVAFRPERGCGAKASAAGKAQSESWLGWREAHLLIHVAAAGLRHSRAPAKAKGARTVSVRSRVERPRELPNVSMPSCLAKLCERGTARAPNYSRGRRRAKNFQRAASSPHSEFPRPACRRFRERAFFTVLSLIPRNGGNCPPLVLALGNPQQGFPQRAE